MVKPNLKLNESRPPTLPRWDDRATLERFWQYINWLTTYDMFQEAYDLARALPSMIEEVSGFEQNYPEFYQAYQEIIIQAEGVALPLLPEKEILGLMEKNFVFLLGIKDLDLMDKLKAAIMKIGFLDQRDVFKKSLREALSKNEEKLTSQELSINDKKQPPTVANWLRDYNINVGIEPADKVILAQYLTTYQTFF